MNVGKLPVGPLRQTVERRAHPYSVDRRQARDDSQLGSGESYERDATTADLYLYEPSSTEAITEVGEQSRGELQGLCLPDADIEVGDRIDYGRYRYEVLEPITHIPDYDNPLVLELAFERVTNPTA